MTDDVQDLTLQVLRQIRDEIVSTNARLDVANERLEVTNERLGHVETTLQELAGQQAFVSKFVRSLAARDRDLAADVDELRDRVEALERRTG